MKPERQELGGDRVASVKDKVPKYAPAREDGLKPWFAEVYEWGRVETRIVWADTAANARYKAINRMRYTRAKVRRATPEDLDTLTRTAPPSPDSERPGP